MCLSDYIVLMSLFLGLHKGYLFTNTNLQCGSAIMARGKDFAHLGHFFHLQISTKFLIFLENTGMNGE